MKNTKFRRRALVSSVAMLLVALVALGSATFAWFSADPNAHTHGLTLKANASTGLLIQSETEKAKNATYWSHDALLNTGSFSNNLPVAGSAIAIGAASQDASSGTNRGIYRVDAASDGQSAADNNKAVTAATTANHDMYAEKLYLKVTGADSATVQLTKVSASLTGGEDATSLAKAIRIAVLKSDGSVLGIWKPSGAADNRYLLKTSSKYSDSGVTSGSTTYTGKAFGSAQTISLGSIGNNGEDYVTVRVYLDGEDAAVYSLNIGQVDLGSILTSVVIDFTIPTTP